MLQLEPLLLPQPKSRILLGSPQVTTAIATSVVEGKIWLLLGYQKMSFLGRAAGRFILKESHHAPVIETLRYESD